MGKIQVNPSTGKVLVSRDSSGISKLCSNCCTPQPDCECEIGFFDNPCFGSAGTPVWLVVQFSGVKNSEDDPYPFLNDVPICLFASSTNQWFTNLGIDFGNISVFYETNRSGDRTRLIASRGTEGIFCDDVNGDSCAILFTNQTTCSFSFTSKIGFEGTAIITNLCD